MRRRKTERHRDYLARRNGRRSHCSCETPDASHPSELSSLPSSSMSARGIHPTAIRGREAAELAGVEVSAPHKCSARAGVESAVDHETVSSRFVSSRSALDDRSRRLLSQVPRHQFVTPRRWQAGKDWVPSSPGFLDLYSGAKGVARSLAELGNCWVITFELDDGAEQDVLKEENRQLIEMLLGSALQFSVRPSVALSDQQSGAVSSRMGLMESMKRCIRKCCMETSMLCGALLTASLQEKRHSPGWRIQMEAFYGFLDVFFRNWDPCVQNRCSD